MLQNIPTHVIAGPLGAGKTSLIRQLMAQRPAGERWAVLINEFGQVGLDAALLTTAQDGIALGEVAGGCLCCVNGAPFQIGLGRLLRQSRPQRLFIEPSGLGHPAQLLKQLNEAPWAGVLDVQPSIMVLDAEVLACGRPLPPSQQEALAGAGLLVMNKSREVAGDKRLWISSWLPAVPLYWTDEGQVPLSAMPLAIHGQSLLQRGDAVSIGEGALTAKTSVYPQLLLPGHPIRQINPQPDSWSIGWRWHASSVFDPLKIGTWLKSLAWQRAKMVIHSTEGWQSLNAVDNLIPTWKTSEWRKDSRIELIFSAPQDEATLDAGLRQTLLQ
ncbi:MAG: CobW family GTP-binding protein [Janthinobacterium lividum]